MIKSRTDAMIAKDVEVKVLTNSSKLGENQVMKTHSKQVAKMAITCVVIEFRIEHFKSMLSLHEPGGEALSSQKVVAPSLPNIAWVLDVYPSGSNARASNKVAFFVRPSGLEVNQGIDTVFKIYLLDEAGSKTEVLLPTTCRFGADGVKDWGTTKLRDIVEKKLHKDGSLLVVAEITMLRGKATTTSSTSPFMIAEGESTTPTAKPSHPAKQQMRRDVLVKLLETGMDTDCTIVVDDVAFKVHRAVLSASSASFEVMFSNGSNYIEASERTLHVVDYPSQPVNAMLDFIYTGEVDWARYQEWDADVLALADKYGLPDLKTHMEGRLAASIATPLQMMELAQLADTHSSAVLKKACALHLANHFLEVVTSSEWEELKDKNEKLALELLEIAMNGGEFLPPKPAAANGDDNGDIGGVEHPANGGA